MPLYEFECTQCNEIFDQILSVRELEKEEVFCPKCGSREVKQLLGASAIETGLKGYRGKVR